jgi:hypothetical protein
MENYPSFSFDIINTDSDFNMADYNLIYVFEKYADKFNMGKMPDCFSVFHQVKTRFKVK